MESGEVSTKGLELVQRRIVASVDPADLQRFEARAMAYRLALPDFRTAAWAWYLSNLDTVVLRVTVFGLTLYSKKLREISWFRKLWERAFGPEPTPAELLPLGPFPELTP